MAHASICTIARHLSPLNVRQITVVVVYRTYPVCSHRTLHCRRITTSSPASSARTSGTKHPPSTNPHRAIITRVALPMDMQMLGAVHGGTVLGLMEEAGDIAAAKYCNLRLTQSTAPPEKAVAVLGRVERAEYLRGVRLGETMHVAADVVYTTPHSLQLAVTTHTDNFTTMGATTVTSRSMLWYVPLSVDDVTRVLPVSPHADVALGEQQGRRSYDKFKETMKRLAPDRPLSQTDVKTCIESDSSYIIHPIHCGGQRTFCRGGVIMKWMDESAGITAFRYCRTACVTAGVDVNFYKRIEIGSYVTLTAHPVYMSGKVIDVKAMAYIQHLDGGHLYFELAADAYFTFVLLKSKHAGHDVTIPPLVLTTDSERRCFEERRKFHEERKSTKPA